jgi:hypothetical protein
MKTTSCGLIPLKGSTLSDPAITPSSIGKIAFNMALTTTTPIILLGKNSGLFLLFLDTRP